jgi:hypothetical protein
VATANLNDMSILATDPTFGNRVFMALMQFITVTIPSESITAANVAQHVARHAYGQQILNGPPENYKTRFVDAVAVNQIVANGATNNGTLVGLTAAQIATQALLSTDTDITNAIRLAYNSYIYGI